MSGNKPLFDGTLRYCVRCCIPQTEDGAQFDEAGICRACNSSEQKMHIDWRERQEALKAIFERAKQRAGNGYDCIVPISGGKDSTFQLHVLTRVYGLNPLAVTFNHNWYSATGWYNLINSLEQMNVDHVMFTPNRSLVNRMSKRSLELMGDTCWHCHKGCGAFPLQMAVAYGIPLIVYGESAAEGHNAGTYLQPIKSDRDYFVKVSAKFTCDEVACEDIALKELRGFVRPSPEQCEDLGLEILHLGNYIFWDDERQTEFVRDTYHWRETEIEQAFKHYKSAECMMPGMHDFTCYLKRGYARATSQANLDVRNGLMTREEAFGVVNATDPVRPEALDYFLKISGMTEEEFFKVMESHRRPELKGVYVPVIEKKTKCVEKLVPFYQQYIESMRPEDQANRWLDPESVRPVPAPGKAVSFLDLPLDAIFSGYADGSLDPVDVARLCVDVVDRREEGCQAWEEFDADKLMAQAHAVRERLRTGRRLRKLEGVPVGIKDVFNTTDFMTQMGSPLWKGFTPGNDARVVFNLRDAGAVIPGKTVTAEFAVHALGKTLNPHESTCTPGTSSSGSAVAVATGMVPVSMGTQTAGSIIRPASFCGVYAMKPSFGLVPRTGVLKTTDTLDTIGFFAGHYADLRKVFEVVRVRGWNYPVSHAALSDPARQEKPLGRPWKVGVLRPHVFAEADSDVVARFDAWLKTVADTGAVELVEAELPESMARTHEVHATIYNKALSYYFQEEYKNADYVSPIMKLIIALGRDITVEDYRRAMEDQVRLCRDMDAFAAGYDVMLTLSTAGPAPLREIDEKPDSALMWTMTHVPVVGIPALVAANGMPVGVQAVARRFNDYRLLSFCDDLAEAEAIPARNNPIPG